MVSPGSRTTKLPERYELLEPLGRGGMGTVWLAHDAVLQRRVAIKEVQVAGAVEPADAAAVRARVMREARAAARLNHPNVTTVYDVIHDDDRTWIVMEYVDAPTLAEIVAGGGPLPPQRAAQVGLALLAALEAAHEQGIVHRDVKPGNVMVPPAGPIKLADFGVAAVQGDPKITMTGLLVGSPSYMAPEQAQERETSPATDLWGLGATLYYAVEGVGPFQREGALPTLAAVAHDEPRTMTRAGPLAPLLARLLHKDPAQRPAAAEVRRDLQSATRSGAEDPTGGLPATVVLDEPAAAPPLPVDDERWPAEPARARGPRAWPVLLATLVLLAVAAVVLPRLLGAPSEPQRGERVEEPADEASPGADDAAAEDSADGGRRDAGADADVPDDWPTHTVGNTGTALAYPPGWTVEPRDDTTTDLVDPAGGRYLRVQYTDAPKDDAVADWEQQSASFGARHDDYTQVDISRYDYPAADTAALWEYTYSEGGADLHAYNLAIVIGGRGYALNFQTREEQWEASQDVWQQIVAGFDPAS